MQGDKIPEKQFEIVFEKGQLIMRNINIKSGSSFGLYRKLDDEENFILRPGVAFRIGTLEFEVERFNTGIVSDIG